MCLSFLLVFKFNLINVKKGFKMFPLMDIKVTSLVFHVHTAIFHQTILNKEKFTTFCNEHFISFSLNIPAVNQFLINYTLWFFFYYYRKNQSLHRTAFIAIQSDSVFMLYLQNVHVDILLILKALTCLIHNFHNKQTKNKWEKSQQQKLIL